MRIRFDRLALHSSRHMRQSLTYPNGFYRADEIQRRQRFRDHRPDVAQKTRVATVRFRSSQQIDPSIHGPDWARIPFAVIELSTGRDRTGFSKSFVSGVKRHYN
jgi:hypothetical protein